MNLLLDTIIMLISLVFLAILLTIAGAAIPGLFSAVLAPWLDWLLPLRKKPWNGPRDMGGLERAPHTPRRSGPPGGGRGAPRHLDTPTGS